MAAPKDSSIVHAWSLADIRSARDAQMRGDFYRASQLADSMRTDDALSVAYENRLSPQRCIPVRIKAAAGARGASIAKEAEALFGKDGVGIRPETMADIHACLVDHGVAFATCTATPREDGSRVDFEVHYWPIRFVRWDDLRQAFMARVDPTSESGEAETFGGEVEIVHGDGRWVVFQKHEHEPFKKEAAIVPASLVWARHAFAARDWAKGSVAHGNAKVVGEMPEGMALQDDEGELTVQAAGFLALLRSIASDDAPAGIRPYGSKTDFMTNTSSAWQVWSELVLNAERAAARIYLGTDGTLGAKSDAPGVNLGQLFGVAATRVEGDLRALERAILTGVIEPWCAVNFGDSTLAPQRCYEIPDGDQNARIEALAKRHAAFFDALERAKTLGFVVDQPFVDALAEAYAVDSIALPVAQVNATPVVSDPAASDPAAAPAAA